MSSLAAIVGPTSVGKSKLAFRLAQAFDAEIVSADSRQVYHYMDIGTAKPSPEERALIPHHLIDIVDPDSSFNLALYQQLAYKAIDDIQRRGRLAILVGGSGLYVWSVIEGWQIPKVPPEPEVRFELEQKAMRGGVMALYKELQRVAPLAAQGIDPRNVRRVIRALEILRAGVPSSQLQQKRSPPFQTLIIGLTTDRGDLYQRIDSRVDGMIKQGLVEEMQSLLRRGYGFDLPAMSSLGYKQIGHYLRGKMDLPQAIQRIKFETHCFARHQYAWFRPNDKRIRWFDIEVEESIKRLVQETLQVD
jgi:tRNA dimethylallyltransferase